MEASIRDKYEVVIGLEVHAQMLTKTKAYSNDVNEYGSAPNSNISVVTLGHPGTLPVMNKKTIEFAIKLGLACDAHIAPAQHFARKNYFYPDLPKDTKSPRIQRQFVPEEASLFERMTEQRNLLD